MHSQIFLVAATALLVFACSSKSKTISTTLPAPTPSTAEVQLKLPTPAADKSQVVPKNEVACERGAEVRTLRIESLQPKGCNLWYSTYSSVKPTAWSSQANTHCEQIRSNIRQKLVDAGFKCSDNITTGSTSAKAIAAPAPAAVVAVTPAKTTTTPAPAVSATPAKSVTTPTPASAATVTPVKAVATPTPAAAQTPSKVSSSSPTPVASPNTAAASPTPAQSK